MTCPENRNIITQQKRITARSR